MHDSTKYKRCYSLVNLRQFTIFFSFKFLHLLQDPFNGRLPSNPICDVHSIISIYSLFNAKINWIIKMNFYSYEEESKTPRWKTWEQRELLKSFKCTIEQRKPIHLRALMQIVAVSVISLVILYSICKNTIDCFLYPFSNSGMSYNTAPLLPYYKANVSISILIWSFLDPVVIWKARLVKDLWLSSSEVKRIINSTGWSMPGYIKINVLYILYPSKLICF